MQVEVCSPKSVVLDPSLVHQAPAPKKGALSDAWRDVLRYPHSSQMQDLRSFLRSQQRNGQRFYPPSEFIFEALNRTPPNKVKVVILGQDPYHGPNQAHGLSFSVMPGVTVPPSLRNIYKEMESDLGLTPVSHGCLSDWADQGVLLLNSVLTVNAGQANSHQGKGWEGFTDEVIEYLATHYSNLVFIFWGAAAQRKGAKVDPEKHCILSSPHPSPFSAHRGFLGSRPFSLANRYLLTHGKEPINWQLRETFVS
ncbi:MAG: uracil-DNA glycosylase [Zetaproteobacteria bacterium]|nr:uracil-DNA glycosylase [Zetaproteobacteria bacterium]